MSREFLAEALNYDPETGQLLWRVRPRSHFRTVRGHKTFNTSYAGRLAGTSNPAGYLRVRIADGIFMGHLLIWKLIYDVWPEQVDHVNRNPSDNRLLNLRECSRSQNSMNRRARASKTGLRGVYLRGTRWFAKLADKHLGVFDTAEEAIAVRRAAAEKRYGVFA